MVGKTIAHYEILEPLGAGGMGEVYRARDTKLERDVAIKVLPEDLADDPDRLARLQREAKLLAALNHPNIATVHALEGEDGSSFLVLELVTGESLERKLAKGPLPVEKALDICKQIAEALEAAHGEGIIHRDLKPANVLVTPDGRAKVLDFGIAKSMQVDTEVAATAHATNLTVAGTLVGTPSYMSPEQVRGGAIDKRADIWAFGCLLFETLTAKSAFAKETMADTLAAIVHQEPDWNALPTEIPPQVRRLIERCLRKDPDGRLHDIADARIEIEDAPNDAFVAEPAGARGLRWPLVALAAVAMLVVNLLMWATLLPTGSEPESPMRFRVSLPEGLRSSRLDVPMVFSPDGKTLVQTLYRPSDMIMALWTRRLDQFEWEPLAGTANAIRPFFSPNGQWIGFVRDGGLHKISVSGGAASPIAMPSQGEFGASSWGEDNVIVTTNEGSLYTVSAAGDEAPDLLAEPAADRGELAYDVPRWIPGTDAVLFTIRRGGGVNAVAVLESGQREPVELLSPGSDGRYLASGHLLYLVGERLFVAPFDADGLATTGDGVPMIDAVYVGDGRALAAVSTNGTLAYFEPDERVVRDYRPVWHGLDGPSLPLEPLTRSGAIGSVSLAPDDQRFAYGFSSTRADGRVGSAIMLYDLETGRDQELVSEGADPVWSPDNDWIYYRADNQGTSDIFRRPPALGADLEPVRVGERQQQPVAVSPVGGWVVYNDTERLFVGRNRLWIYSLIEKRDPHRVSETEANQVHAAVSADGQWIAWHSNATGSSEVYVTSFPHTGEAQQVSQGGGSGPVWPRDNPSRLFYRNGREVFAVDFDAATGQASNQRVVLSGLASDSLRGPWDVSSDGQRLLVIEPMGEEAAEDALDRLQIVLDWFEELKRLVPTGR